MKKYVSLLLACILAMGLLTGCGSTLKADRNTIYVQKKGTIIGATVEPFDKEYYDADELESYIDQRVARYSEDHGKKSVKVENYSVEDETARLNIKYAGYEDYSAFNEVELFAGTVPQAQAAGYDFEGTFSKVEDGKMAGTADKDEVTEDAGLKTVILNEKVDVKVDGTILYMSSQYTSLKAKDTVSIALPGDAQDGEELTLIYIIYK